MKVIFAGTPKVALPFLEKLIDSAHEVVAVISQPDKKSGRGQELSASAVSVFAEAKSLKLFRPKILDEDFFNKNLQSFNADVAVVVAYGQILPENLLSKLTKGWINVHFSILPKFRGAAPVQHALLNGESETGVTVFQIEKGLDSGPIWDIENLIIKESDNTNSLLEKLSTIGSDLVLKTLGKIESNQIPVSQTGTISFAAKLHERDFEINWSDSSQKILNIIKAGSNDLAAHTLFQGNKIKILNARVIDSDFNSDPGQITIANKEVLVVTGDGVLALGEIIPQGKKQMSAMSWLNGVQDKSGLKFQ